MNSETMPSSNALRGCCAEFVSSGMLAATEHSFQTTSTREQGGRLDAQLCSLVDPWRSITRFGRSNG